MVSQYVTGSWRVPLVVKRRTLMSPNDVANVPSLSVLDLETLGGVADLRSVRLPFTALVATLGHRKHDPIAVPVDVGPIQHLVVDLQDPHFGTWGLTTRPATLTSLQTPNSTGTTSLRWIGGNFVVGLPATPATAAPHISAAMIQATDFACTRHSCGRRALILGRCGPARAAEWTDGRTVDRSRRDGSHSAFPEQVRPKPGSFPDGFRLLLL